MSLRTVGPSTGAGGRSRRTQLMKENVLLANTPGPRQGRESFPVVRLRGVS